MSAPSTVASLYLIIRGRKKRRGPTHLIETMESVVINPCSTPDDSQRVVVPKARNSTNNFEVVVRDRQEGKNPFFFSSFFLKTPPRIFKKACLPVTLLLLPCLEFSLHLHPRLDHLHRIGEHACRRRRLHKRKNKVSEVWMGKKD